MCINGIDKILNYGEEIIVGSHTLGYGLVVSAVVAGVFGWHAWCVGLLLSGAGVGVLGKMTGSILKCRVACMD